MTSYEKTLPQVFPYSASLGKDEVRLAVSALSSLTRTDVPFGSSFAVVSGTDSSGLTLWMSRCSLEFLRRALPSLRDKLPQGDRSGQLAG